VEQKSAWAMLPSFMEAYERFFRRSSEAFFLLAELL
jgi:hypothetical protein